MSDEMLVWRALTSLRFALHDLYFEAVQSADEHTSIERLKNIGCLKTHVDELDKIFAERFPKPEPTIGDVHKALTDMTESTHRVTVVHGEQ